VTPALSREIKEGDTCVVRGGGYMCHMRRRIHVTPALSREIKEGDTCVRGGGYMCHMRRRIHVTPALSREIKEGIQADVHVTGNRLCTTFSIRIYVEYIGH
jgi:hypothetical protein